MMKFPRSLRFITWNCMSCFPQYYDEVKSIERGAPKEPMEVNRAHNTKRYGNIVQRLHPYLTQLQRHWLTAITLQEVDSQLLQMIREEVALTHPQLYVHHTSPYYAYPPGRPPHDFSYHLVTIHHKSERACHSAPSSSCRTKLDRCLVTTLKSCVVYNVHIPWVSSDHPVLKHHKTEQTVRSLADEARKGNTRVIIGDLNLSCPFNRGLYKKYFAAQCYVVNEFGESYKLSAENVRQRKTFKMLDNSADDGCITHRTYTTTATFDSLRHQQLPVDKNGWFLPPTSSHHPSDHALVAVHCTARNARRTKRRKKRTPPHRGERSDRIGTPCGCLNKLTTAN